MLALKLRRKGRVMHEKEMKGNVNEWKRKWFKRKWVEKKINGKGIGWRRLMN